MKKIFEITNPLVIEELYNACEYGTLALSDEGQPYSVPVNFVHHNDVIYFHGSQGGKKMKILRHNPLVSFSVVQNYALIASYFSSKEELACPATQFFKSLIVDGEVVVVEDIDEKRVALTALMQKLQAEGGYKPFSDKAYDAALQKTAVLKIIKHSERAKFKFGQHLDATRFTMIVEHLQARASAVDLATVEMMLAQRDGSNH